MSLCIVYVLAAELLDNLMYPLQDVFVLFFYKKSWSVLIIEPALPELCQSRPYTTCVT